MFRARTTALATLATIAGTLLLVGAGCGGGEEAEPPAAATDTVETDTVETDTVETGPDETETGAAEEETGRPDPVRFQVHVPAGGPEAVRRLNVFQGERVEIVVTLDTHDDVHLHGYDLLLHTGPGLPPARFAFRATMTGRFTIETETNHETFAVLRVRPS